MAEFTVLIIEAISMILFLATTGIILFTIVSGFKGMKKPPFWIYLFSGFLVITFHGVLSVLTLSVNLTFLPNYAIPLIRVLGNLLIFLGFYKLWRAQSSTIKFDRKLE